VRIIAQKSLKTNSDDRPSIGIKLTPWEQTGSYATSIGTQECVPLSLVIMPIPPALTFDRSDFIQKNNNGTPMKRAITNSVVPKYGNSSSLSFGALYYPDEAPHPIIKQKQPASSFTSVAQEWQVKEERRAWDHRYKSQVIYRPWQTHQTSFFDRKLNEPSASNPYVILCYNQRLSTKSPFSNQPPFVLYLHKPPPF
jgi:hypothetical protein